MYLCMKLIVYLINKYLPKINYAQLMAINKKCKPTNFLSFMKSWYFKCLIVNFFFWMTHIKKTMARTSISGAAPVKNMVDT